MLRLTVLQRRRFDSRASTQKRPPFKKEAFLSAVPAAPSTEAAPPTQETAPAPHVEESTTVLPGSGAPETPLATGTEGSDSEEQPDGLPENWHETPKAKALWKERETSLKSELEKQHEYRLAQQHNDMAAERQRSVDLAKADKVVLAAAEAFEAIKAQAAEGYVYDGLSAEEATVKAEADFKRMLKENESWAAVYGGEIQRQAQEAGTQQGIYDASLELYQGLSEGTHNELAHYVVTELNKRFSDGKMTQLEVYRAMREKRDELLLADYEKKLAGTIESRLKGEAEAQEKAAEPGPVKVNGRASNGKITKSQLDSMSAQEVAKIPIDQLQAIVSGR